MRTARAWALLLALTSSLATLATPYWVAWEGDDWPENQGWERGYTGGGAVRTLENGAMTIDGTASTLITEAYYQYRTGQFDPDPGEYLAIEWRMRMERTLVYPYDVVVSFRSDDSWSADLFFALDRVRILPEFVVVPFEPNVFHDFRLVSYDLRSFQLHLDGALVYSGPMDRLVTESEVIWGDGASGAASRSTWDYFRYGAVTIPEPRTLAALLAAGAVTRRRHFR